jgi:hypothetical protein
VAGIFDAYRHSRFGYVTVQAPGLLQDTVTAARAADGDEAIRAHERLALSYQAAAVRTQPATAMRPGFTNRESARSARTRAIPCTVQAATGQSTRNGQSVTIEYRCGVYR